MKLFSYGKDGGPESKVHGFWLIEWKRLFSIVLLRFDSGSREAYHTHAFNSVSWVLWGRLVEFIKDGETHFYYAGFTPIRTKRNTFHMVGSSGTTYALSFRGPWIDRWKEYLPREKRELTLTNGRQELAG